MNTNQFNLDSSTLNKWMIQEMELAMQRLNVSLNDVQSWLNGKAIPSDPQKYALFECIRQYTHIQGQQQQHHLAPPHIPPHIDIPPHISPPHHFIPPPIIHNHTPTNNKNNHSNNLNLKLPKLDLPPLTPSTCTNTLPPIVSNVRIDRITNAIPPSFDLNISSSHNNLYAFSCSNANSTNIKKEQNINCQKQKQCNFNHRIKKEKKSKYKRPHSHSNNHEIIKVSKHKIAKIEKFNKLKNEQPIKSRGGGGLFKRPNNANYELLSRVDVDGPLSQMRCDENKTDIKLYHCYTKRTDKIKAKDGKVSVKVIEGYKCKTANCKYPHLYSQRCHWKRHALTEHCCRKFECTHCGAMFRQQTQRNEHIISKHTDNITKWLCPYACDTLFSQFRGVVRHVKLNRKCYARNIHFNQAQIKKLKDEWNNEIMKKILIVKSKSSVDSKEILTDERKESLRETVKKILQ